MTSRNQFQEGDQIPSPSPQCEKCIHVRTCVIYRLMGTALASNFSDEEAALKSPVKVGDIAKICELYERPTVSSE